MTRLAPITPDTDTEAVMARIAARAADADAGRRDLTDDMVDLRDAGLLDALSHPDDPVAAATLLRRIGRANLSVGRLAEGHMNALALIRLYGTAEQRERHRPSGPLLGVWGADGDPPARVAGREGGQVVLAGGKRFASGLGIVGTAVVTVPAEGGTQLVLIDATDPARADASGWQTSGMRATASGHFRLDGLTGDPLGAPGDYEREPHFEGGVWRYAALHVGGLEAIAEAVRQATIAHASEAQLHRLARLVAMTHAARLMVEAAAEACAATGAGETAVALSLAAREQVEEACLRGIALADRALGTRSFATGATVERVRRDLGFFLRQANLDGKLERTGRAICDAPAPVGEIWGTT